jgi:hypothetical protein
MFSPCYSCRGRCCCISSTVPCSLTLASDYMKIVKGTVVDMFLHGVMTLIWPRRSPWWSSPFAKSQPKRILSQDLYTAVGLSVKDRTRNSETEIEEEKERASSSSGYRDPLLSISPCVCSRPGVDLACGYGLLQWYQRLILPRCGCCAAAASRARSGVGFG